MTVHITYLENKIKLYEEWRNILYKLIDTTHFSPENKHVFNTLSEIQIRLDELFQLKMAFEKQY